MIDTEPLRMIGDMPQGGWINRLPGAIRPYVRLMRLDRPIGTWLLLFPCWWSGTMAMARHEVSFSLWLWLMVLFGIGAVILRGAGCTINDVFDRDIDVKVARTAVRPLANGDLTLRQALVFFVLLLLVGFVILIQLNWTCILLGLGSIFLLTLYPLMKRLTNWPQAWLGLTFNWGALMGWCAVSGRVELPAVLLYLGGVLWTLGYDTIYAHQDKEDDVRIGVKSSALALGDRTRPALFLFYGGALILFISAGVLSNLGLSFFILMIFAGAHLFWQAGTVMLDDSRDCLETFNSNRTFAALMFLSIVAGSL